MYLRHFNFETKPFAMNPDPAFLFPSEQHSKALTMLEYAMESQAAFCVLTGEIGSGKTTLVRRLIRTFGDRVAVGLIAIPTSTFAPFIRGRYLRWGSYRPIGRRLRSMKR